MERKKILILVDWFYPGYKAGGPIQSCRNFTAFMNDSYELSVVTSDRDLGDAQPYNSIQPNQWNQYDTHTRVFYAQALSMTRLKALITEVNPDYVYVNSMFSLQFAIYPFLLKRSGFIKVPLMVAPRGMLKPSALAFKPTKKKVFLALFKLLKLQQLLHFHATDATEVSDTKKMMGASVAVTMIPNFPGAQKPFADPPEKQPGQLRMIFVGRIHPIKKLDFILQCLQTVKAGIEFTIVAAVEDEQYWLHCNALMASLPASIQVNMKNDVPHDAMNSILQQQHLFVLPTKGENFGHAIFESLAAGRPVLISDQTPWRALAASHAGWDLPLNNPGAFTEVIEKVAAMPAVEHLQWCKGAWQFCHDFISHSAIKTQYLKLFN